jgi:hypothetical protein
MKVRELINSLQALNLDLEVVVRGYEGGYENALGAQPMVLVKDYYKYPWMGKHESAEYVEQFEDLEPHQKKFDAVLIY